MATEKVKWIVATACEAEDYKSSDIRELERSYPYDYTDSQIALSYAENHDIGCGDRPMIYEKQELVVYAIQSVKYDSDRPFIEQAKRFVVKGELVPWYSIVKD